MAETGNAGRYGWLRLAAAVVFCIAITALAQVESGSDPKTVVARVNRARITEADLQERVQRLYPSGSGHSGLRPEKLKGVRAKALDDLVIEELAWQQAQRAGRVVSLPQTRREYARVRAEYGASALDRALRDSGLTRQQYLKKLQRKLTVERAVRQKVDLPSRLDWPAVSAYYSANQGRFNRPERVRVRLILAAAGPNADAKTQEAARRKIDDLYRKLQAGEDFAQLASNFSEDVYRANGGDVGWMHKGSLDPEFEALAFSLPIGQISQPIRNPLGFSLMKVEAREPARQLTFTEVREGLRAKLQQKKRKELWQAWTDSLRRHAVVEVLDKDLAAETSVVGAAQATSMH